MRLENRTNHKIITEAIQKAHALLLPESPMMLDLRNKNDFAYNSGTGEEVYQKIIGDTSLAFVFTYKPKWRWSKAMGYSDKVGIHINILKLDRLDFSDLVGLLCHESMHQVGFGHGNNFKTKEKCEKSVPYYVSENIKKWVTHVG